MVCGNGTKKPSVPVARGKYGSNTPDRRPK